VVLIFHKIHKQGGNAVLAICDKEVCGKTLQRGDVAVVVSEKFYKEKEIGEAEARRLLHRFGNINIIGNKAVRIAIEEKVLSIESVIEIGGVKHAQIFEI